MPSGAVWLDATRLSRSMAGFSTPFASGLAARYRRSYNPPADAGVWTVPLSLAATHGIDYFFLFLRLLRCFTWPGMARFRVCTDAGVTPFGHLRINACYPLPEAFRSLLRPSSPDDAKASIICCNWFMQTRSILGVYLTHLHLHISKLDIMLSV